MHIENMEEVVKELKEKYHWTDSQVSSFTDAEKIEALKQLHSPKPLLENPNETTEDVSEADAPSEVVEQKDKVKITKAHRLNLLLPPNSTMLSGSESEKALVTALTSEYGGINVLNATVPKNG